jgi:Tol biopolymer transport system component
MVPLSGTGGVQYAESGPSWSHDGRLVYWSYGAGIAIDGGTIYRGTTDPYSNGDVSFLSTPDWSPDGSKVVFARGTLGARRLAIVNASGGGPPQDLGADPTGYEDYEPTWIGGGQ